MKIKDIIRKVIAPRGLRLGNMVRVCPGKNHAWFETKIGVVRKPL